MANLLLAGGITALVSAGGFVPHRKQQCRSSQLRWMLLAISGGMIGYCLYALNVIRPETWGILPDTAWAAPLAMAIVVLIGALVPVLAWRAVGHWRDRS